MGEVSLPRLAQGGYVKANTPQLAWVGDNKTQGEIIAPEDKLLSTNLEALKMFFKEYMNAIPMNTEEQEVNFNIYLDNELIQRISQKRSNRKNLATNGRCS